MRAVVIVNSIPKWMKSFNAVMATAFRVSLKVKIRSRKEHESLFKQKAFDSNSGNTSNRLSNSTEVAKEGLSQKWKFLGREKTCGERKLFNDIGNVMAACHEVKKQCAPASKILEAVPLPFSKASLPKHL